MSMPQTDLQIGNWVDRYIPKPFQPYARLMRLDRPIGTWLLLWPCLWSLALASPDFPDLLYVVYFAIGALIMRGAGCVINDIYDRDLDKRVERTCTRPLAVGQVELLPAILFACLLLLIGLLVLVQFSSMTILWGVASLGLVLVYPLAKRFTYWPQLVLGLAFNWGALLAWVAVKGQIELPAVLLYIGGIFWTLGYDTIYAHQDKKDDMMVGIKSLALYLGENSRGWISAFYALFIFFIALAAYMSKVGMLFYLFFPAALIHVVWQVASWKMDDPSNCLARFRSNRDIGLIIFLALLAGRLVS